MVRIPRFICLLLCAFISYSTQAQTVSEQFREEAESIIKASMENDDGWKQLTYFVDKYSHRLSGSETLERSIDWIENQAKKEGFDVVVLGASREGMLQQAIKGNIPEAIASGVDCTVILVRG